MSCVLRITGKDFDVDQFILKSGIIPYQKWHKGEPRLQSKPDGKKTETSGCSIDISKADFNEFDQQLKDVAVFIKVHAKSLKHIRATPDIDRATMDFGVNYNIRKFHQGYHFTADFLRALSDLGIDLELSVYGGNE